MQILYWLSTTHSVLSLALVLAFYQLKVPLITFRREKQVARKLYFDGTWIKEEDDEERSLYASLFWCVEHEMLNDCRVVKRKRFVFISQTLCRLFT